MVLRIYNTLTEEKEIFSPLHGNRVKLFVCGPTVYDYSHLGHARTYIVFDTVARYLRARGYSVFFIMNITDIDDKIIARASELNIEAKELAEKFTNYFYEDMEALSINSINLYPKATDYIPEIIEQIKTLIEKGYAYQSNGNVYFEVKKFEEFGKLSKQSIDQLRAGARVEVDERKKNYEDFVLWKEQKPKEPFWDSPFGKGRPGWHIEDTAITLTHFGAQYDLHGGGIDLIFPHHECEIAQAECTTGKKPFVKYWLHTGMLTINREKMSKSLGNFFTIREVLEHYSSDVVRFFLLNAHYRSPLDYSDKNLDEAKESLTRIKNVIEELKLKVKYANEGEVDKNVAEIINKAHDNFFNAMDDDFNTREAIATVFEFTKEVNALLDKKLTKNSILKILNVYKEFGDILGIFKEERKAVEVENLVELLVKLREEARARRDWQTSDKIREELSKLGIVIEDTAEGTKVKFLE
ncbi:MAG: cysteine--tRNA ligase [Candidatus Thermoplasmatota archaeon]|nr:cysteine--tRNA ligase [Candidatus Thermoplasmatota archaeon]